MLPASAVVVFSMRRSAAPPPAGYTVVRVDRKSPLGLGNPYPLPHERDRSRVIARYRRLLARDLARGGRRARVIAALAARVRTGERLALACWCAPKPCHAEALREAVLAQAGMADA